MAFSAILYSAESSPPAPLGAQNPKPDFYLILDYLPQAIYDGETITACLRVENTTSADAEIEFTASALDSAGAVKNTSTEKLRVPAKGFAQCQNAQESKQCSKIVFSIHGAALTPNPSPTRGEGGAELAGMKLLLLRDDETWPATKILDGRLLVAANGELLIPAVEKRNAVEDRAFLPLKWLLGPKANAGGTSVQPGRAAVFVPNHWRWSESGKQERIFWLGPYSSGVAPVLQTVNQVLAALDPTHEPESAQPQERAVILLPPEDLELATAPRLYRIALDCLLARLPKLGIKQTVMVSPVHFGVNERHRQTLWKEVHAAAAVYGAKAADPIELLDESMWRVDPAMEGVYGLRPNQSGLKKIEQAVGDLVR